MEGALTGLSGARCLGCGVTTCPAQGSCPRCGQDTVPVPLSDTGVLWTWTVQRFPPKSPPYQPPPGGFRPFAVGYVELPEGVRVAAVIEADEPRIGMPLRLVPTDGVPHAR